MHLFTGTIVLLLAGAFLGVAWSVWREAQPKVLRVLGETAPTGSQKEQRPRTTARPTVIPRRTNRPLRAAA